MGAFWGRFFATIIGLVVINALVKGVQIDSGMAFIIGALVVGFVNAYIRPVVQLLALPITIVTFGIFALIVNGLMLGLAAAITPGFSVQGCGSAVFAALLLSIVSAIASAAFGVEDD
ncbi:MAG: phage holin family protein [Deltaproteobacteria bacterium]|nr:phage holin family protein [bacterium]MCB9480012.1 phage holin family protein [Deltaproteobacteria bacterium]MCB9487721.1 phage holin family protein [Deltaproteobacteria bacterium]